MYFVVVRVGLIFSNCDLKLSGFLRKVEGPHKHFKIARGNSSGFKGSLGIGGRGVPVGRRGGEEIGWKSCSLFRWEEGEKGLGGELMEELVEIVGGDCWVC